MKLATIKSDHMDGRLFVVSRNLKLAVDAGAIAASLLTAVEAWTSSSPRLAVRYEQFNAGRAEVAFDFDPSEAAAPLAHCCGNAAFLDHGHLMEKTFKNPPIPDMDTIPLMYQGGPDELRNAMDDVPLLDEAQGIDFEGEFGVVIGDVPIACPPELASQRILLLVQINDVSLRAFGLREMRTGFGFFHAKPSPNFALVVATLDDIGGAWRVARGAWRVARGVCGHRFAHRIQWPVVW